MPNNNIHILLVSAQAAPNLLAALDPVLKPNEAVLIVSGKMQARADDLEAVLKEAGVKTARVPLEDEHDFGKLQHALLEVAATREGQQIALNVTGGTKLMALAALSIAQSADWRVFYVDVDTDEVIWLDADGGRQKLSEQLRLRHYLRGYGFHAHEGIQRPQLEPRFHDLLQTLVTQTKSLAKPLGQLNWLAQEAQEKKRLDVKLSERQRDSLGLDALLRHFSEAGVAHIKGDTLYFASEQDRFFANGGWLEHHTFRSVARATADLAIRDKAANLIVENNTGVKNELDIAFLARNRLFVIECKTARMDKEGSTKANDTLFKLAEICRRVGGLGTRGMLISYRSLKEAEQRLAKALQIEIVSGGDLARLDEKLKNWVNH